MSLELARAGEDIAGVVGFHSGLGTAKPGETKSVKPKILICIGAEDPLIPPDLREDVRRLRASDGPVEAFQVLPDSVKRKIRALYDADKCRKEADADFEVALTQFKEEWNRSILEFGTATVGRGSDVSRHGFRHCQIFF